PARPARAAARPGARGRRHGQPAAPDRPLAHGLPGPVRTPARRGGRPALGPGRRGDPGLMSGRGASTEASREYRFAGAGLPDPRAGRDPRAGLLPAGMLPPGRRAPPPGDDPAACAGLAWARSGLMHPTGQACGPPLAPRAPVLARAAALTAAIARLTSRDSDPVGLGLDHVLAFRASLNGWSRGGTVSANGTCRILRAADGWLAVNLARPDDLRSVPAVLGRNLAGSDCPDALVAADAVWDELRAAAASRPAAELRAAARAVGIPASALPAGAPAPRDLPVPVAATRLGSAGAAPRLVLDLSAMWAGPLCASILGRAGWRVLKVEDVRRPDGARS